MLRCTEFRPDGHVSEEIFSLRGENNVDKRKHTFQLLGATRRTSSRQNSAWECNPWDRYKSESSVHASMSVGDASNSATRASIASFVRERLHRSAMRRLDIGYWGGGKGVRSAQSNYPKKI